MEERGWQVLAALMELLRDKRQYQREAATESPKEEHSRMWAEGVQSGGVCFARRALNLLLTSARERSTAHRSWWEVEREATAARAEWSQVVAEGMS